jgi:hypothetical protein
MILSTIVAIFDVTDGVSIKIIFIIAAVRGYGNLEKWL